MSLPIFNFREIFRPGAFAKSLDEKADIFIFWSHDRAKPLGRTTNGTATVWDGTDGVRYKNKLGDTTWADDAYSSVQRRDVTHSSFSFRAIKDIWSKQNVGGDLQEVREVVEAEIYEFSPVTMPAYDQTFVNARSLADAGIDIQGVNEFLLRAATEQECRDILVDAMQRIRSRCLPADIEEEREEETIFRTVPISLLKKKLELATL